MQNFRKIFDFLKDLKFGPKDAGKVLNQRAEQCRRVQYEEFVKKYDSFDEIYSKEFLPRFHKKNNQIPPRFVPDVEDVSEKLSFEKNGVKKSCEESRMAVFVKSSRFHFYHRKVLRLIFQEMIKIIRKS